MGGAWVSIRARRQVCPGEHLDPVEVLSLRRGRAGVWFVTVLTLTVERHWWQSRKTVALVFPIA